MPTAYRRLRVVAKDINVPNETDIVVSMMQTLEEAPTIKTKEIKYYDESENVWKIGEVIVDE